jgi:hypothetical protein
VAKELFVCCRCRPIQKGLTDKKITDNKNESTGHHRPETMQGNVHPKKFDAAGNSDLSRRPRGEFFPSNHMVIIVT